MTNTIEPETKQQPPLTQVEREDITDIANGQADVTRDGGHRSSTWTPYLVDQDTYEAENPYKK